jgi:hypothetical protein
MARQEKVTSMAVPLTQLCWLTSVNEWVMKAACAIDCE